MIKRLSACIREYKKQTILTPTCMVGEVVCECTIPLLTADLINSIQNGCEMQTILFYGLRLFVIAMLSLGFGSLSGWFAAEAAAGFAKNLRHDLFYQVQGFSFANIDRFSTSSLVTRLTTDVTNIQNAFMMLIRIAVRAPMMLVFAVIMSARVGKRLAFVFAGIVPILGFALFFMIRSAMPLFKAVFKKYDALNNSVQENVQGMRVVKSFVREDYETQKFSAASDSVRADFLKAEKILALNSPVMQFCVYTSMILISFFAAKFIIMSGGTYLGVGSLTSMITYSMQILMSLMMLSMIFVMLTMAQASGKRICEVLDETSSLQNPENPVYEVENGDVDFEHVEFKYSASAKRSALSDIDFHVKSGQTVGIIGGTGSAKTTLVQLICRLYDVTGGSVRVGGRDVREYDLETLRNQVAVVLQKRTHRVASEPKCHRVAFVQQPNDLGYEDGVGYLHLPIPLLWPDSTPSLPPRWADSGACRSVSGRSPPTSCHTPVRAASRPISSTSTTAAVSPVPAAARVCPPSWPAPGLSG